MRQVVNLIPAHRIERRRARRAVGAWTGSLALSFAAGLAAVGLLRFEPRAAAAREVWSELASLQERLAAAREQVAAGEAELAALQPTLSISRQLSERADWSVLLEAIAQAADGRVALEKLSLERESGVLRVDVSGLAQDHADSNSFLLSIERIGVFDRAHLVQTSRRTTALGDFVGFEMRATLKRETGP